MLAAQKVCEKNGNVKWNLLHEIIIIGASIYLTSSG
jgi:hypothetical protein